MIEASCCSTVQGSGKQRPVTASTLLDCHNGIEGVSEVAYKSGKGVQVLQSTHPFAAICGSSGKRDKEVVSEHPTANRE
jgi:hypothetical protein